jgi:phospholipase/carboxylesterase
MTLTSYAHRFIAPSNPARRALVLLHGSGGSEHDLVPLAEELARGSPILAIRGDVEIDDGHAFFHHFPDRSVDEADIRARVPVLAEFMATAGARFGFTKAPTAVGFSNGAIMAAALLLTHPSMLAGAILFRPLLPFRHDPLTRSNGVPVLIIEGERDSRRSPGDGLRLSERLTLAGATVTHHVLPVGHSITASDRQIARDWIEKLG